MAMAPDPHRSRNYDLHTAIDMNKLRIFRDDLAKEHLANMTVVDLAIEIVSNALGILREENDKTRPD